MLERTPAAPHLSVIIPVYNGERYLAEAVESVRCLEYEPLEVIIVDDGSTDGTRAAAHGLQPPCRYAYQANQGPPAARNRGLSEARGEIIALLDADDRWPPSKLRLQLPHLLEDPDVEMVLGNTQYFRTKIGPDQEVIEEYARPFFIFQLGCALIRRTVFEKVGLFDPDLRYGDDVDWLLRTRELHVVTRHVDAPTILYRRHEDNMTRIPGHEGLSRMAMLKRSLDRRRARFAEDEAMGSWFQ